MALYVANDADGMATVEIILDEGAVIVCLRDPREPNEFLEDVRANTRQYLNRFYDETGFYVADRLVSEVRLG